MCTFLGTAGNISDRDVDENQIKNSELIFWKDISGMKVSPKSF